MISELPQFYNSLIPLDNTPFDYQLTSVPKENCEYIWKLIRKKRYKNTIEIGCALGVSSLYICDAISQFNNPFHTIIDPKQKSDWHNIGIRNLQKHDLNFFNLIEEPSELALPKLLEQKYTFDMAFIDGWHTFDHALVDFFYLNRMIKVGGIIVFDDATWNSISKLIRYISNYPAYKTLLPPVEPLSTFRQKLFHFLCMGVKFIPLTIRREIFSERVILDQIRKPKYPRIVGLMKVSEDTRMFDWYVPF